MAVRVRWDEFVEGHRPLAVENAVNALDQRWHRHHSTGDGSEFTVEGFYSPHVEEGSRGVPVSETSLGSTCLTQLAGFVAVVSLPSMPPDPARGELVSLEPPYTPHQWLRNADWSGIVDSRWGWGTAYSGNGLGFVQVCRVAVAPEGVTPEEAGTLVQRALPGWWRAVVAWLELLSGDHVRSVDDFHWSEGASSLYTWSTNAPAKTVPGRSWMRSTPRLTSAWNAFGAWSGAVQLAGLGQVPPSSCTLLMAALRAFREGECRTCVSDAGTAAEVALRRALLRIKQPPRAKATLGEVTGNAEEAIDGLVPDAFQRRMIDVRNRVIHDGRSVSEEIAASAFNLAQLVVHRVHPLPEVETAGLILTSSPG